ncbi:MAG: ribose 5-phosphate isomerase B [Clostridia bacterium]|nr:ribose 5-phosphate isomerase B [Clostridia bacterium]
MIAIGADHGGYELKEAVKKHLDERKIAYKDFGTFSGEAVDYPIIAKQVGEAVAKNEVECGILVCGTGIGMSIAANKVKGIRAACCSDTFSARFTKMHNDTNVLCFGGRVLGAGLALDIVDAYLDASFEGGRHEKRVNMIMDIENN